VNIQAAPSDLWTKLTAIGTISVVAVALLPIFIQWNRTRSAKLNLRARILSNLTNIEIALLEMAEPHCRPESKKTIFNDADNAAIEALGTTLPELVILSSDEQILIPAIYTNVMGVRSLSLGKYGHRVSDIAKETVLLIKKTKESIEKKGWYKGKFPKLPWDGAQNTKS